MKGGEEVISYEDMPKCIEGDEMIYIYSLAKLFNLSGNSQYYEFLRGRLFMLCENNILSLDEAIKLKRELINYNYEETHN